DELRDIIARALDPLGSSHHNSETLQPITQSAGTPRSVSSSRILLAEDNLVNQRVVQRILEKAGHSVVAVGNGREALEALRKETFDLALMDVQMSEMDGFEATRAIRQTEKV